MAYTKQVWTDGSSPLSAARFNYMETGIAAAEAAGLSTMPRAQLYANLAQPSLPAGWNKINLDTALIDTHGGLDVVNKGWKVPAGQAGIYMVDGSAYVNGQVATYLSTIWINGGAAQFSESGGGLYLQSAGYALGVPAGNRLFTLNAGDLVTLMAYGTVANWTAQVNVKSWMSVVRLS